ncbi:ABC transporter substrate-binding protein [Leptolyngbya iicbica]|uniref:Extracellular solute-binding protein n=2 Tax=Cyanophyceae TaxID=3028117 RepID=A0A4Q7E7V2_9CYAN|nr:extracellular solute-binding protein [Leptolyngbya sp. LK]RZM79250.1 extracellular solute-binding protein [Leptolyngbya sp. LK]
MPRKRSLYLPSSSRRLGATRRRFLQGSAAAIAGVTLANCRQNIADQATPEADPAATTPEGGGASGGDSGVLHVYTWADYTNDEMVNAFTEQTGIEVIVDIYDSNETMLAKMQAGGGDAYSIIYPSDYMVQQMIELNMLTKLEKERISGIENIFDKWQDPVYDPGNSFSVPFAWGTTGLLYNTDIITDTPTDWDYLWENSSALSKRMTLLDDVRETMGMVLKSLGYSYNSTDPAEIEEAYERLIEIKPDLASFMSFGFEDGLLSGDLAVVMAYSVDALSSIAEDETLNYIIPESGSSVWTDTLVIPTTAPNVDAAYEWINFNLQPEIAQLNTETLFNATPNQVAFENLSDEFKNDEKLFPPEDLLAKCEGIAPVGDASSIYDEFWTRATSA